MTRRGFIRRMVAAVAGMAVAPLLPSLPTPIFTEFVDTCKVGDFQVFYYWQAELLCDSPRSSFIIESISE